MTEIEIPQYFICPISLQIMRDPVTAVTGITYERESIEHWLMKAREATCPVTKQPLPRDSDLTPNHTLRRLIQAWSAANSTNRIPTPKSLLNKTQVSKLIRDLDVGCLHSKTLKKIETLAASGNERNRKCLAEAGMAKAMILLIIKCFKQGRTTSLEEGLNILNLTWTPSPEIKLLVNDQSNDLIDSLTWVLQSEMDNRVVLKTDAMIALKTIMEVASPNFLERLNLEFFRKITKALRERISNQATKSALHVLIATCPFGGNRNKIVETGLVFDLIELELEKPEKKVTELIFCLLANLCCCADGREKLIGHAGGIAVVTKRLLRVSPATDDRAVLILAQICKFSGTNEVLLEMLRVGAVSKLFMVLQADCATYLKNKARGVLRLHSNVWNNSPCIQLYLLTMYPR